MLDDAQNWNENNNVKLSYFFTPLPSPSRTSAAHEEEEEQQDSVKMRNPTASICSLLRSSIPNGTDASLEQHTNSWFFEVPCLQFNKSSFSAGSRRVHSHKLLLLENAATHLSCPLRADRSNADDIPLKLLCNISKSIYQLIRSRLRASIAALIAQTIKLGDFEEADVLHRLYLSRRAIYIMNVATVFRTVKQDVSQGGTRVENEKMIERISFETTMEVSMLGNSHTLKIHAPGTIAASWNERDLRFKQVRISLDTIALLKSMINQARIVVNKTTKRAVRITAAYSTLKLNGSHDSHNIWKKKPESMASIIHSSLPEGTCTQTAQVLLNYPTNLRETVEHFYPSDEYMIDNYLERFPPQLARTLILLAQGNNEDNNLSQEKE
jgi:hypothetical protein